MPAAEYYTLLVDDRPLWATTSKRQAYEFASPYIADKRQVRILAIKDKDLVAECEYDILTGTWRDISGPHSLPQQSG